VGLGLCIQAHKEVLGCPTPMLGLHPSPTEGTGHA